MNAASTMESLLKNLKEHVTCSICLDTFTDPKKITCLHTFCFECIKKHALISQRNGTFRCPECQAEVDLPEANRFDKLPTSFHHNSLLSVLAIRQSGRVRLARFARVRLLRHTLPISLLILRKKPTVLKV